MPPLAFLIPFVWQSPCSCGQVVAVVSLTFMPCFCYVFQRRNFKLSSLTKLEKLSPALTLCLVCSDLLQALMSHLSYTPCAGSADPMSAP